MMMGIRVQTVLICALTGGFLPGCSNDPVPRPDVVKVVDASGIVTYKGKPLAGYQVSFRPESGGRVAAGVSDADGRFVLGTNAQGDGAVAGKNLVAVTWANPGGEDDGTGDIIDDPSKLPKPPVALPPKYGNPDTSGIVVDVPEGGSNELTVELQ